MSRHPGTITFVDGNVDRVLSVDPVADVPEALRFVDDTPVVRIVAVERGDERVISLYGPNQTLLRTTLQRREP